LPDVRTHIKVKFVRFEGLEIMLLRLLSFTHNQQGKAGGTPAVLNIPPCTPL
jgi:hypothetical protein